jgi:hypothetical protein
MQAVRSRRRKGVTFSEDVQIVYIEACNEGRKVWENLDEFQAVEPFSMLCGPRECIA